MNLMIFSLESFLYISKTMKELDSSVISCLQMEMFVFYITEVFKKDHKPGQEFVMKIDFF